MVVAVVVAVVLLGDGSDTRTVRFEVTAEGGEIGEIFYGINREPRMVGGPLPGAQAVQSPWSMEYEVAETARVVVLNAATLTPGGPVLTCRILVDGEVRSEHTKELAVVCDKSVDEIFAD